MDLKIPGLYIHIPFCRTKCGYCNFYSVTSLSSIPDFLEALWKEMEMVLGEFGPFDTVYIGGGTPSVLSLNEMENLLERIQRNFVLLSDLEMTVEVNPADLDLSLLRGFRSLGVNRLNIGIQSFDQKILNFLGRRHSSIEAISAIETARKAGFENIGLDLIYGVPGQDIKSWLNTLLQALAFDPEHLSCYQLTLESKTPLGKRYEQGEFSLPGEELEHEFFIRTAESLEAAGYIHYEVSNFARDIALISRHNQKYWDHTPYLGLGPAAHSFSGYRRWWNHRSVERYITDAKAGKKPIEGAETLTTEQLRLEALFLGLRTKKGVCLKKFVEQYGCDLAVEKREVLDRLQEEGLVAINEGYLVPTRAGLAVADGLALI
jgi:oxygen-independent coproporphyrinogen III oxidase